MILEIPENKPVYNLTIKVLEQDIDELHHVNNLVYLKWVLEAAQSHWLSLTDEALRAKYQWVVLRHEIDYLKPALLNDQLKIITWVEWHKGVKSMRQVTILKNNQVIVEARTIWCLLDARTLKPRRIEKDISELYL
ncbi:MAG: acyl-CoA thioesterase [Bacteroidota bacterium]|nr:acyl-CoA thioesterase [Bacteroidota bacterium]